MPSKYFDQFAPVIASLTPAELNGAASLFDKLTIARDGDLQICYAPFEALNREAKLLLVGITPGRTQMLNVLREYRAQVSRAAPREQALLAARRAAGFSGDLRAPLVELMDHVGINQWLRVPSCELLFGVAADLIQTTSLLRNPVFVSGERYNGKPNMLRQPELKRELMDGFVQELRQLPDAMLLPMGDTVSSVLLSLARDGLLARERILDGLPHPSRPNVERVAYFLGRKQRSALSVKTNPDKLDAARAGLRARIAALGELRGIAS